MQKNHYFSFVASLFFASIFFIIVVESLVIIKKKEETKNIINTYIIYNYRIKFSFNKIVRLCKKEKKN